MAFSHLSFGQFETQLAYVKPCLSIIASVCDRLSEFCRDRKGLWGLALFGKGNHQTAKRSN
jgi:hypothetical protein